MAEKMLYNGLKIFVYGTKIFVHRIVTKPLFNIIPICSCITFTIVVRYKFYIYLTFL